MYWKKDQELCQNICEHIGIELQQSDIIGELVVVVAVLTNTVHIILTILGKCTRKPPVPSDQM
jgi:hypothetical protein